MNFSLTEKIRELCEKKGISFFRLEKELHLGNGTIRAWDQNRPSIDKVESVADYFGVSVDYLMGRNEPTDDEDINCHLKKRMKKSIKKGEGACPLTLSDVESRSGSPGCPQ